MKTMLAAFLFSLPLLACGGQDLTQEVDADPGQEIASKPTQLSVGKLIFNDTTLSQPAGQSCATCHDPNHGFADGRGTPTSEGATAGYFGVRNTPGINYASYTPTLGAAGDETGYAGGLFWDGRAATLEVQAGGPLVNPIEMGNPDKATVVNKVKSGPYASKFKKVFGASAFANVDQAFTYITQAVSTFERQGIPNRFTSKYDAYLAGTTPLTVSEARGLKLFDDPKTGVCLTPQLCGCAQCHLDKRAADGSPPLFTDFGYDNIGIPKNPNNGYYNLPPTLNPQGKNYVDNGLSAPIHNPRQAGKFKAPSLRNVALTAPYGHNGYFADLASVVRFYNTRDVPGSGWDAPEVTFGMNTLDLGNLGLSAQDEADLVAFMNTLTDGYAP